MGQFESHLKDEELLLAIDGELSGARAEEVEEHLETCWDCRARKQSLEKTISNLVEARHAEFESQVQTGAGVRALLKANLAQIAAEPVAKEKTPVAPFRSRRVRRTLVVALAAAAAVTFIVGGIERVRIQNSEVYAEGPLEPRPALTPGAVRSVNAAQVCRVNVEEDGPSVRAIPASVREEVFREYGMSAAKPQYFEIDFLITPELGGSNDIKNLWPEPYRAPVWNAHVKDQLEDFLRDKVCKGEMDLSTAQHDIAADWILAYKKYFHTDRPL
jgi:anti-sigma factor RsiW